MEQAQTLHILDSVPQTTPLFHQPPAPHSDCNARYRKWGFTDNELCDCGEIQTMSHIVNSCPLTKFDGGLLRLHEADEAAVDWLTTYGS